MTKNKIIMGSRGSKLAILYAEKAKKTILDNHTDLNIDTKIIKTSLGSFLFKKIFVSKPLVSSDGKSFKA